jgi:hypothetical protein
MPVTYAGRAITPAIERALLTSLDEWLSASRWCHDSRRVLNGFDAIARDLAPTLAPALALALALALDRDRDRALALTVARIPDLDFAVAYARARDRARDRDRVLALALASALDVARDRALDRDRALALDVATVIDMEWTTEMNMDKRGARLQLAQLTRSPEPPVRRRASCLEQLLNVLESETSLATASAWRRFFVTAFNAIREDDPKLVTEDLFAVEAYFRVLVAREEGTLPAWEGLRVVRQKRL